MDAQKIMHRQFPLRVEVTVHPIFPNIRCAPYYPCKMRHTRLMYAHKSPVVDNYRSNSSHTCYDSCGQ